MKSIQELKKTVASLRAPGGCPWDIAQTHQSLCDCLIEETAELLDTIDRLDMPHMREELGDVLLQVIFHAQLAEEKGHFNLDNVAQDINEKLIRRHPHVFGDSEKLNSEGEVLVKWDEIKANEKKNNTAKEGVLGNIPPRLSSLLTAREIFKKAKKKGISLEKHLDKEIAKERAKELDEDLAGKKLFEFAVACKLADIDPESALRRYTNKILDDLEEEHK